MTHNPADPTLIAADVRNGRSEGLDSRRRRAYVRTCSDDT
jgi:hypothetical protein